MTTYARVWWSVVVVLGALGALEALLTVGPFAIGAVATTVAAMTGLLRLMQLLHRNAPSGYGPDVARAAGTGAVVGVVVAGLAALVGSPTTALLLVVACLHPRVLGLVGSRTRRWLHGSGPVPVTPDTPRPRTTAVMPRPAVPRTDGRPVPPAGSSTRPRDWASKVIPRTPPAEQGWPDAEGLRVLSTSQLCWGWRTSFTALQRTDPGLDRGRFTMLVAVRQRYLDEIARRDPAGFARWLYSGARPASDPTRYLLAPAVPGVPTRRRADAVSIDSDVSSEPGGPHA